MKDVLKRVVMAAALGLSGSALAQPQPLLDVQLVSRSAGGTVPVYWSGQDQYAEGSPGERYSVRLTNRSGERILAVLSVDGVNAVSGETAAPGQAGYVIEPWQTIDVDGWRKSTREVARFYFTRLGDSYAARTGRAADVGVIGVAAFRERRVPTPLLLSPEAERAAPLPSPSSAPSAEPPAAQSSAQAAAPRAMPERSERAAQAPLAGAQDQAQPSLRGAPLAPPPASNAPQGAAGSARSAPGLLPGPRLPSRAEPLGTGHGEREQSEVTLVAFERARDEPDEVHSIFYDSRDGLIRRGVILALDSRPRPRPFPAGFVADPPCCR